MASLSSIIVSNEAVSSGSGCSLVEPLRRGWTGDAGAGASAEGLGFFLKERPLNEACGWGAEGLWGNTALEARRCLVVSTLPAATVFAGRSIILAFGFSRRCAPR